jgi:hypothetical protein
MNTMVQQDQAVLDHIVLQTAECCSALIKALLSGELEPLRVEPA